MKVEVEYLEYMWPIRHFLITCGNMEKPNIITLSFCMPVSKSPPLIACAIGRNSYSHKLIKDTGEFILNVPTKKLKKQIYFCGYNSGRDVDKFNETRLTAQNSRKLKVPIIAECIAHLECRLCNQIGAGDKDIFIGKVLDAYADEDIVKGHRIPEYSLGNFPTKVYSTRFT